MSVTSSRLVGQTKSSTGHTRPPDRSLFHPLPPALGVSGVRWSLSRVASLGVGRVTPWTSEQFNTHGPHGDEQPFGQFRAPNCPHTRVFGLLGLFLEAGGPTQAQREHANRTQKGPRPGVEPATFSP